MGIVLLSPTKKEGVINLPLIDFNFLSPDLDVSQYDLLVFTSKTAVEAINRINKNWRKISSLSVGKKTTKEIEKFGGKTIFTGNGYGESLVPKILKNRDKKILFIRGKEVANDLKELVKNDVEIDEIVVYETLCKTQDLILEDNSVIIFTAPSTVKCFFKNYNWKESYKAVAIGTTTRKELPKDLDVLIPENPTFEECIKLAK